MKTLVIPAAHEYNGLLHYVEQAYGQHCGVPYTRIADKRLFESEQIELPHSWYEFANQQRSVIGYPKILDA
jgi:hypothetical protein